MRLILVIALCLVVASAKYVNKNNRKSDRSLTDFETDQSDDDWSDQDDMYESSEDDDNDDQWRSSVQHHQSNQQGRSPQNKKQHQKRPEKIHWVKWTPQNEDDDDYEDQPQEYVKNKPKRHHRNEEDDDEEPEKPCQPNYQLLKNMDQINFHLAARLYQEAKNLNDDQNTIVSPIAAQLGLAAVSQGARGSTRKQINQLLDYGMEKNQNKDAYMALVKMLKGQGPRHKGSKNVQIKSTTNIILSQQTAQEQFIESIKSCFDGEVKRCDFHTQPQQCLKQINQFISTKTNQKLQNPLHRNSITQNTKMISVNTIQVKAKWGKQVEKNHKIGQGQFYPLGEKQSVAVKTLQVEGDFNYFEDNQLQIVGLQSQEKQLTTYLILPKHKNGLNKLEKQRIQYGKQLEKLIDDCDSSSQTLKIQLPLFQIVHELDSKNVLQKVGIEDAFDFDRADFSGIHDEKEQEEHLLKYGHGRKTGGLEDVDVKGAKKQHQQKIDHLHLNKFIQQATIQINENGIDSANSQNQQYQGKQQKKDHKDEEHKNDDQWERGEDNEVKIDHAFAFFVKHNPSNQLLLIGRVIDPTQHIEPDQHQNDQESE